MNLLRTVFMSVLLGVCLACSTNNAPPPLRPAPLSMPALVEGTGPSMVMLGGGATGAAGFAPHAQQLALTRRVIRLQALNVHFAEEGRPLPDDYGVAVEATAMSQALDGLALRGPVDVLGWSYGALVALEFALAHPDQIPSLILVEPPAFWIVGNEADMEGLRVRRRPLAICVAPQRLST